MLSLKTITGLSVLAVSVLCSPAASPSSKVATGWLAGWHLDEGFPLSNITWDKYTHMTYSFAETTPDVNTLDLSGSDPSQLPNFVSEAHKNNVKALVSIGGWTGSRFYSSNVATSQNRTKFAQTILAFAKKYQLDGIDFDWEYPNNQGIGCNVVSSSDTANFLSLLQLIRADAFGKTLILTAATAIAPFMDATGNPSSNVAPFAKVLNWVAVMNYDIWGPWSPTVGPNAPLNDTCAASANQAGSAVSAVAKWSTAGFPTHQIVLGVPSYGHAFSVPKANAFKSGSATVLASYPDFSSSIHPAGDAWDDQPGVDVCGNQQNQGGIFNFWGLISGGFLNQDGSVNVKNGIVSSYDTCSQTPYVYNPNTEVMVSYDNAKSFAAKGSFIKDKALGGFAMWEVGGDHNNILINSIRNSVGF
ncbi:hypothetical protein H0H92_004905 [Tricholoma furcatifolium]|nr:hypothetical protein H0H92_004905 [Tricholoma furcatifolium]